MKLVTLSWSVLFLSGFVLAETPIETTPASENPCNLSCGFDHANSESCVETPAVNRYLFGEVLPALDGVGQILNNSPIGTCFCGLATMETAGYFSNVEVVYSSNSDAARRIKHVLEQAKFPPLPDAAACILEFQPLPLSFDTG